MVSLALFGLTTAAVILELPTVLGPANSTTVIQMARQSLVDAAASARSADQSLAATATASSDAAVTLHAVATTLREGAAALRLQILGQQPFIPLAQAFDHTADRAEATAESVGSAAASIAPTRTEIELLAGDLDALAAELNQVKLGPAPFLACPALWLVILGSVAWLTLASGALARLGWLLREDPQKPPP